MRESKQVHEESDGDVYEKAGVDALGPHRQASEVDAGDDGAVGFEVRLAEVDHAVRNAHREAGSRPERTPQRPEPTAATDKLEADKLTSGHAVTGQEVAV